MSLGSRAIHRLRDLYTHVCHRTRRLNAEREAYPQAMHDQVAGTLLEALEPRVMLSAAGSSGFDLIWGLDPLIAANSSAVAALDRIEERLEGLFGDSVSVVVDLTLAADAEFASTLSNWQYIDYDSVRSQMISDSSREVDDAIVAQLPTSRQLRWIIPDDYRDPEVDFGIYMDDKISCTTANLKALGFDADSMHSEMSLYLSGVKRDGEISYNPTMFNAESDFDASDGIGAGLYDFESTIMHEVLHLMGFDSSVDTIDSQIESGRTSDLLCSGSTMDLFRLQPGQGAADFTNSPRLMVPWYIYGMDSDNVYIEYDYGLQPVFYADNDMLFAPTGAGWDNLTAGDIPLATGEYYGDGYGYQASHFRDNHGMVGDVNVGLMDPSVTAREHSILAQADVRVLDLIGWDYDAPVYEPDNSWQQAVTLDMNGLPQIRSINSAGDVDWATFTLANSYDVIIETDGNTGDGDIQLWLYGSDNLSSYIGYDNNLRTGVFSRISMSLLPGTYYVKVGEVGGNESIQSYTLSLTGTKLPNEDPVLASIGSKTINELDTLSFTASATDADVPNQPITYALRGDSPSGVSFDTQTGAFNWTPSEDQDGVYSFKITASDGENGTDSESFTVTVNEVNVAPVLASIGDKMINELNTLSFTASATDADVPNQTITYALTGDSPSGVSFDTETGTFSWTPSADQGGVYSFTITASDGANGTDSETFAVTVGVPMLAYMIVDGQVMITDCDDSYAGEVIIPATIEGLPVTSINHYAFYYCTSLTSVTIPDSVTSIGDYAFYYCTILTSVTIPDSVTSIGSGAFRNCYDLTSVTIPDGVTSIGDRAFHNCHALTSVTFEGDALTLGTDAFSGAASNFVIYYYEDATGFTTPTWNGYRAEVIRFPVELTSAEKWTYSYTDTNGDAVTVKLSGATDETTMTLYFYTDPASEGFADDVQEIELTGTGPKTQLSISVKANRETGDGTTTIGQLTADGLLKGISGKGVSLTGDMALNTGGATPTAKDCVSISLDGVTDGSIDTNGLGIKSLSVMNWADTDATPDTLDALYVSSISVKGAKVDPNLPGNFQANIATTGTDAKGLSLGKLAVVGDFSGDHVLAGAAGSITVGRWATGSMDVTFAKSISNRGKKAAKDGTGGLAGDFGVDLSFTGADANGVSLGKFAAAGTATGEIRTAGSIGSVAISSVDGFDLLAGIDPAAGRFPTSAADFVNPDASIKSVKIAGIKGQAGTFFQDCNIAAATIGSVGLCNADFDTGHSSITALDQGTGQEIKKVSYANKALGENWSWPIKNGAFNGPADLINIL